MVAEATTPASQKDSTMRLLLPGRAGLSAALAVIGVLLILRPIALGQAVQTPPTSQGAAAATDSTPQADAPLPKLSPIDLFWKAGFFIWPLSLCSILSVAVIIERFVALRREKVIPAGFVSGLKRVYADGREDREQALRYCEEHDSPLARMIGAGIRRMPRGVAAAEKAIEDNGANETLKLRANMRFLYSMGSVATLLGLIGTIAGMIKAFQVASVMGPGHADKLSEGIYEAMVNTFAGLAIAIVVTIFYYFFIGRIEKLVSEMNDAVNEFGRDAGFDADPTGEVAATTGL